MSLATLPKAARTGRSYVIAEYVTADGVVLRLRVSREVAETLADEGAPLKALTLTDLAGKKRRKKDDGKPGLDPELMLAGVARRVQRRRQREGQGSAWEGPHYHFDVVLGVGRPMWLGGEVFDEEGRCGICHGARLAPSVCCGSCWRTGRDGAIGTPAGEPARRRAPRFRPRLR